MTSENIRMSSKDGKTESWEKTIRDGNMTKCIRVEKVENGKVEFIETGEMKIIDNPRECEICRDCSERLNCIETFDVCASIKLNDTVIGVIGFVCTTESQKAHILKNYDTFIKFLVQISDLIASKAFETEEKEKNMEVIGFLKEIINNSNFAGH